MKNKIITAVFIIALVLFILTFSIALPIYCRFFYYLQIKPLGLEQKTGWSYDVIKESYDEVLNFCTLPGRQVSAGKLLFSDEGAAHFADCKTLFTLNLSVLIISGAAVVTIIILHRLKKAEILKINGHGAYFYSAVAALILPAAVGALACINFDAAFEIFHKIFFPGKDNWVFNPRTDEIIKIMPQQFFINCAILIGSGLVAFSAALIITDAVIKRKNTQLELTNL